MFTTFRHRSLWTSWSYRRILSSIFILSSLTRLGVSGLLLPDVPSLVAVSLRPCMCTRVCGGSWVVIWFVSAFRCHTKNNSLEMSSGFILCKLNFYHSNSWWYLKFLSSLEKQICFHLILETQQSTCWHFFLLFILPCFMETIIKKVLAKLEYSICRFLKHFLN